MNRLIADKLRECSFKSRNLNELSKDCTLPKELTFNLKELQKKEYNKYIFFKELLKRMR